MRTWNERIAEALVLTPPKFTRDDVDAATSWCTCKWGEMAVQRKLVGLKFRNGMFAAPADWTMHDLGTDFTLAVCANAVAQAAALSERMEARAQELAESAAAHDAVSV